MSELFHVHLKMVCFLLVFLFEEKKLVLLLTVKLQNYGEVSRVDLIQNFVNFNCLHTA